MNSLLNMLYSERDYFQSIVSVCAKKIKNLPEGSLWVSGYNGYTKFYIKIPNGKKKYIPRRNASLLRKLAEKEYYEKLYSASRHKVYHLNILIDLYENESVSSTYSNLHIEKQKLFVNELPTPENLAASFENAEYNENPIEPGTCLTSFGKALRSKSEVIIAEMLHTMGIPFHYDEQLILNDGTFFYPDFTLYDAKNRRKIYWEHFGMLDNEDYARKAMVKISKYAENGIIIGNNLICTFETSNFRFPTEAIKAMLEDSFAA